MPPGQHVFLLMLQIAVENNHMKRGSCYVKNCRSLQRGSKWCNNAHRKRALHGTQPQQQTGNQLYLALIHMEIYINSEKYGKWWQSSLCIRDKQREPTVKALLPFTMDKSTEATISVRAIAA